jgi:glycosyltransferase involved in cell wall biosynthesis
MVEIGIPAYNSGSYISDAIKGCLMQQYKDFKIIVADDCSSDNTVSVVQNFQTDKRVVLSRNERNLGRVGNCTGNMVY